MERFRLSTLLLVVCVILLAGCAPLLTGATSTEDALKVMTAQNARGCVYVRWTARRLTDASLIVVGTWGDSPPPYEACWQGLPAGVP